MKKVFFIVFIFLTFTFISHYILVGQAVYGDGIYYWSYIRSLYFDHDLNISNELAHSYNHSSNNTTPPFEKLNNKNVNKLAAYRQPIGTSLVWFPFFTFADILGRIAVFFRARVTLNGYSDIYQVIVGVGSIIFSLGGLYFIIQKTTFSILNKQ